MALDTSNKFLVSVRADDIVILRLGAEISRKDALNLAAYLVVLADLSGRDFVDLYNAVKGT